MALLNCSSPMALAEKERQLVWLLVRQLGEAQTSAGGQQRADRLWQEVAALGIDPDRVIHLLYGGQNLDDREALAALDPCPLPTRQTRHPRRVMGQPLSGGWRQSAPRGAAPAHPAGR